jgi:hypothetical protein
MNSYHLAIICATSNGEFPEMGDLWRTFHSFSSMNDNEYFIPGFEQCLVGSEVRRNDELKNDQTEEKILYVPVTRKVSATDCRIVPILPNN